MYEVVVLWSSLLPTPETGLTNVSVLKETSFCVGEYLCEF